MTMWEQKIRATMIDTYKGVPIAKLPEDLWTYEHLLWEARPDVVVELGGYRGGSARWFYDRVPLVVTVDIDKSRVDWSDVFIEGDVREPSTRDAVRAALIDHMVLSGDVVMVVEDSAHTYETTFAALDLYSDLVTPGSFFVVEDTVVDDEDLRLPDWPRGVTKALDDWLPGKPFKVRDDFGRYGYTTNPGGLLQRV